MKHGLKGLCGAGALLLPLSVLASPEITDLSDSANGGNGGGSSFYEQTEARGGGNLMLLNQLDEQQDQIRQLRGQLEELRHQLEQERQLSRERYLDLEERLRSISESGNGTPRVDTQSAQDVAAGGSEDDSADNEAQSAYQEAFQHVQSREFPTAIEAFERFVGTYPDSRYTANSYYWLGELYSAESQLDEAATAFRRVIDDFSDSSKVPDAMYKLGLLQIRQGETSGGRELLTRTRDEYPDSTAAELANEFLKQNTD
ncbi:tol-pal system protein YbgF [Aidingimonas lacisalsi]|uniref:tol-pal system protein YbgF n=1 Tax=Aidingimonas lacisalsi TaxID=2604086 RepID=UPI0011D1B81C|nr:tol-pal system protein YbgF [Aidingimonas lacisalsi]